MILALCLLASMTHASVITQTLDIPTHTPTGAYNKTFEKFNTDLGTLDSIQITYSVIFWGGMYAADNDSTAAQTITLDLSFQSKLRNVGGSGARPRLLNNDSENSWDTQTGLITETYDLAPTSGDPIGDYNNTGESDHGKFVGPTKENGIIQSADDYIGSNFFADYQNEGEGGTYTLYLDTQQVLNSSPPTSGISFSYTSMQAEGNVTVTYTYTPIPEPATASLAAAGLLLLIRRRRRA